MPAEKGVAAVMGLHRVRGVMPGAGGGAMQSDHGCRRSANGAGSRWMQPVWKNMHAPRHGPLAPWLRLQPEPLHRGTSPPPQSVGRSQAYSPRHKLKFMRLYPNPSPAVCTSFSLPCATFSQLTSAAANSDAAEGGSRQDAYHSQLPYSNVWITASTGRDERVKQRVWIQSHARACTHMSLGGRHTPL